MKEVRIDSIMYDLVNKTPVVILKEINGDRYLPILIGMFEASAIEIGIRETPLPRPMTHDLLNNIINHLQLTVEYILINKIEDSTFYANIVLYQEGSTMEVDSRPSDAIALAVRTHAPILVEEEILSKAGIKMNPHKAADKDKGFTIGGGEGAFPSLDEPGISGDDAEERFRDFIDDLKPEDFLKSDTILPENESDSTGLDELIEDDENDDPV
jgi:bifunctional DNase/RNase